MTGPAVALARSVGVLPGEHPAAAALEDLVKELGALRAAVRAAFAQGVPAAHRSEQVDVFLQRLAQIDPASVTPESMRDVYNRPFQNAGHKEQA